MELFFEIFYFILFYIFWKKKSFCFGEGEIEEFSSFVLSLKRNFCFLEKQGGIFQFSKDILKEAQLSSFKVKDKLIFLESFLREAKSFQCQKKEAFTLLLFRYMVFVGACFVGRIFIKSFLSMSLGKTYQEFQILSFSSLFFLTFLVLFLFQKKIPSSFLFQEGFTQDFKSWMKVYFLEDISSLKVEGEGKKNLILESQFLGFNASAERKDYFEIWVKEKLSKDVERQKNFLSLMPLWEIVSFSLVFLSLFFPYFLFLFPFERS